MLRATRRAPAASSDLDAVGRRRRSRRGALVRRRGRLGHERGSARGPARESGIGSGALGGVGSGRAAASARAPSPARARPRPEAPSLPCSSSNASRTSSSRLRARPRPARGSASRRPRPRGRARPPASRPRRASCASGRRRRVRSAQRPWRGEYREPGAAPPVRRRSAGRLQRLALRLRRVAALGHLARGRSGEHRPQHPEWKASVLRRSEGRSSRPLAAGHAGRCDAAEDHGPEAEQQSTSSCHHGPSVQKRLVP